ncbi:MAG TPA: RNA polymerase sigma factor [Longimicrobiales bacterium]|nr:RNA polymerase sigma factor [Longimicrobiales bacterium]
MCKSGAIHVRSSPGTFDFRSLLAAWISQITYRRCINRLKHRGVPLLDDVDTETSGAISEDSGDEILERVSTEELRARLRVLIEELPVQWRAVITLHYAEGLHIAEIEEITGIPTGTVTSYLHRARARLRQQLEA